LNSDVGSTLDHHLAHGIHTASQVVQGEQYSFNLTKMEATSGGKSKQVRRVPTAPTVAKGGAPQQGGPRKTGGDDFYGSGMDTFAMSSAPRPPPTRMGSSGPEAPPPAGGNPYDTPPKQRPEPTRNVAPPSGQTPYDTPPRQRPGESF